MNEPIDLKETIDLNDINELHMKVAVTSIGETADALLDRRFGRCAWFAIYDTETGKLEFVENKAKDAAAGAGPAAVALVAELGVQKIVSGEFGFKIKGMLDELKIQMVMLKEDKTIADIISLLGK